MTRILRGQNLGWSLQGLPTALQHDPAHAGARYNLGLMKAGRERAFHGETLMRR